MNSQGLDESRSDAAGREALLVEAIAPANNRPSYLDFLQECEHLTTADGRQCDVFQLSVPVGHACLSDWARRFRQTYCLDDELDDLRAGTGKSRSQYLLDLVFPDKANAPGPGVRSGDFAELLISDYIEFILGYWVPRGKYAEKGSRDESVKGVDIVGFKLFDADRPTDQDELLTFEVKAQLSGRTYGDRLQIAVDDSAKDYLRIAQTLAAMKRRMLHARQQVEALRVQRFQNIVDLPYTFKSGAAAVLISGVFDAAKIQMTRSSGHNNAEALSLLVVQGDDLMNLAHALYQRAADEA